ncbi:MAG: hypothetical protein V4850_35830 [Myxococcota bacterium]
MLTLTLLLLLAAPAEAHEVGPAGWGDFPTRSLTRPVGGAVLVRAPRMDRRRFGNLPVRFDFSAEVLASLKDVAVLDRACEREPTTMCGQLP